MLIISVPGEIYVYGGIYSLTVFSMILAVTVINHMILPVFYENNIINCYEVTGGFVYGPLFVYWFN